MEFSSHIFVDGAIFVLGVCGLLIARHIRNHKTNNAPLVCMVGFDCHAVVHSDYSKFLGLPVELLGMTYYALVSVFYLLVLVKPDFVSLGVVGIATIASCVAFIFSIYLIVIQIFVLKKGCSWCIVSSLVSASIFVLTMFTTDLGLVLVKIFTK
jgi:uncharacterized membrane protein